MSTTDLKSMTSKDRRILVQGVLQAVISTRATTDTWEAATKHGVRVMLRVLRSIDPNEKGKKKHGN